MCVRLDSPSGVEAAVKAGIKTIGIATTQKPEDLKNKGACLVVNDFTSLSIDKLWALVDQD